MKVLLASFELFLSWVSSGFIIYFFVSLSGSTDVNLNWYFVAGVLLLAFIVQTVILFVRQSHLNGH